MTEFLQIILPVLISAGIGVLVLYLVYLFLLAPRGGARKKREFGIFLGRIYAHRGVFDNESVPENSLPAFRAAVSRGLGIELDIHLSADGVPVVFHDNTLTRMCRDSRTPEELTAAQLKDFRLLGTKETIPTLAEVLALVGGRVPLIVELKGESGDTRLADTAMPILENYGGAYCVESFNPLLVAQYRKLAPHVMRGILTTRFRKDGERRGILGWALTWMLLNFLARPDFVAARHTYGNFYPVKKCRKMGAAAFAWTIRERAEYKKAAPYFDAFICENVDELLKKP